MLIMFLLGSGVAQASESLARSKMCMNCHGLGGKIVGPGYLQIAAKYANTPENQQLLAQRIRHGNQGVWGSMAMPANAITDAEAMQLARWVLSLTP
jgi:cytochrome c